ncbi:MAG TPA: tetratricopeptide repeat protein, partial [Verrucomicrobiae bacterium]|nr:tetratricopeptide repeat protein [Verrucomicrobiae bacterium]
IHYWLGCALSELGEKNKAREHWRTAAEFKGDFQEMSVRQFSEMTYYSALSWERLGQRAKARKLFSELLDYAQALEQAPAKIDYFATSLPTMLLFEDDLQFRQQTTALFLQAQAQLGLGEKSTARSLLKQVLQRDPNHALARDLWDQLSNGATNSLPKLLPDLPADTQGNGNGADHALSANSQNGKARRDSVRGSLDGRAGLEASANPGGI